MFERSRQRWLSIVAAVLLAGGVIACEEEAEVEEETGTETAERERAQREQAKPEEGIDVRGGAQPRGAGQPSEGEVSERGAEEAYERDVERTIQGEEEAGGEIVGAGMGQGTGADVEARSAEAAGAEEGFGVRPAQPGTAGRQGGLTVVGTEGQGGANQIQGIVSDVRVAEQVVVIRVDPQTLAQINAGQQVTLSLGPQPVPGGTFTQPPSGAGATGAQQPATPGTQGTGLPEAGTPSPGTTGQGQTTPPATEPSTEGRRAPASERGGPGRSAGEGFDDEGGTTAD